MLIFEAMDTSPLHIYLAEDSCDDQWLFKEALREIPLRTKLTALNDGKELIDSLIKRKTKLPDVIFIDLNMPRKSGYECLAEIKTNYKISGIPVIIISTSEDKKIEKRLYNQGAQHYIHKPNDLDTLVKQIQEALNFVINSGPIQPSPESFVI